jgi:nicotinic acid phosphoribosyltransferase
MLPFGSIDSKAFHASVVVSGAPRTAPIAAAGAANRRDAESPQTKSGLGDRRRHPFRASERVGASVHPATELLQGSNNVMRSR